MKINFAYKNILKLACLMVGLAISGSASAGLINGDFSDPSDVFTSWEGEVFNYNTFDYETVNNFGDYSDNFSTLGNSVILSTDFDIAEVYLFQDFTFGNNVSEFSLNFFSTSSDIFSLVLSDNSGFHHNFADPADGLIADVSSLSGQSASLEFSLIDSDGLDDVLTVSDISITSVSVPEPSSFAIFALGLFALRLKATSVPNRRFKG